MNESPNESKRAQVSNLCPKLIVEERDVDRLFATLDRFGSFDAPGGELSVAFVSKSEISRIHDQFMQVNSPTDVITFQGNPAQDHSGEICVSPDFARGYSSEHNTPFHLELTLYLVHGWLHLCGFDDLTATDRQAMRKAESQAMAHLETHNAIPGFKLSGKA